MVVKATFFFDFFGSVFSPLSDGRFGATNGWSTLTLGEFRIIFSSFGDKRAESTSSLGGSKISLSSKVFKTSDRTSVKLFSYCSPSSPSSKSIRETYLISWLFSYFAKVHEINHGRSDQNVSKIFVKKCHSQTFLELLTISERQFSRIKS